MLCDNCGKREANVRYSENINGVKREMRLCEQCSQKLGISNSFSMPIDFSSFFGNFLEDLETPELMPFQTQIKTLRCNDCGLTFQDILNTGMFGCSNCYETFENQIDSILQKIQGSNRHIGRTGKITDKKIGNIVKQENKPENKELTKLEQLKEKLKQAIKEEKYEDAAKLRDEIKELEKE